MALGTLDHEIWALGPSGIERNSPNYHQGEALVGSLYKEHANHGQN